MSSTNSTNQQFPERVSISGASKCGKTRTVTEVLAALGRLQRPLPTTLDCGAIPRQWAQEKGVSIEKFVAEMTAQDDRRIDEVARNFLAGGGPVIAAGRLTWWVTKQMQFHQFRVWLVCDDAVCARRVGVPVSSVTDRNWDDARRYREYYGLTFPPPSLQDLRGEFNLVVSTHRYGPEEVARIIVDSGCAWNDNVWYESVWL